MKNKLTICIPSKNNLRYLRWSIPSIRKNSYYKDHEIIVFIDKDEDGTESWVKENKEKYNLKYIVNPTNKLFGIGRAYDICVHYAENDIVMAFHADMYFGKDADYHLLKYLDVAINEYKIVCSTRIEPEGLHPPGPEKINMPFGLWPETFEEGEFVSRGSCDMPSVPRLKIDGFREKELEDFIEEQKNKNKDVVTRGIFAPWIIKKQTYIDMGGHDYIFHSAREDSDFFNRCYLNEMEIIQSWESFVWHLTQRGGRLSNSLTQNSRDWEILMENSSKDFIRKWGSVVKHNEYMNPIVSHKYNIGLKMKYCDINLLKYLELFVDTIYITDKQLINEYIKEEQPNTHYNLSNRVVYFENDNQIKNDIIIKCESTQFSNYSQYILNNIGDIITESGSVGSFEIDIFKIKINRIEPKEFDYIVNKNSIFYNVENLPGIN